jgi:hypothetical protein
LEFRFQKHATRDEKIMKQTQRKVLQTLNQHLISAKLDKQDEERSNFWFQNVP